MSMIPRTLRWEDGRLVLLDQTRLPGETAEFRCTTVAETVDAIKRLVVRGAPAIGVAAAYGVVLAARKDLASVPAAIDQLAASRPTAINLFWALERMRKVYANSPNVEALLTEARAIERDDAERCDQIGNYGQELLPSEGIVMTHCNAGALATAGIGTALGVIYKAAECGKKISVFVDETRPLLQGSRLTAWELMQAGVPTTLITDNMAANVMSRNTIAAVIVGADRIAANGDVANKIGTYGLAVNARHHGIPFYVAAPLSTFDLSLPDGSAIPIEERCGSEITNSFGHSSAPVDVRTFNPAFDVTPHTLVTKIITDRGVIDPDRKAIAALFAEHA